MAVVPFEPLPGEQWRPVVGYVGLYEISSLGRVLSLPKWRSPGRNILRPAPNGVGYPSVVLYRDRVPRQVAIHVLVTAAFIGPRPAGADVRHLDGNRRNSVLTNLAYGSRAVNMLDAVQHGTHHWASKTACPQGHPYDEANTRRIPSHPTYRYCRACQRSRRSVRRSADAA